MIKHFRKIRQRLLTENKFRKYLIYAIGEIVLVVIGILIALQINNWNQSRQDQKLEVKYLRGIKTNINDDITELEKLFTTDTVKFDTYTSLIKTLNGLNYTSQKQEIVSGLYTIAGLRWFEGQNVVFEDLKFSGKLNLIQSDTIRHLIQKYYRFFEEVVKQESMNNSRVIIYRDRYAQSLNMSPLIESTFNERWNGNTIPVSLSFIDTSEFKETKAILIENISQIKSWEINSHYVRVEFYNQARSLKKLIEQYLNEKK